MADLTGPEPSSLDSTLFGRRMVRLWGALDDGAVTEASAQLMALDATGDAPVQLLVASSGGPLHLVLSLVDTIDLLGVPVHATCLGRVEGAAALIVAVATRRWAAPHAQFHLCAPEVSASGNANQWASWAQQYTRELDRFCERLASACGRHREHVEADLSMGRWLDAGEAVSYGLVDEIWPVAGRAGGGGSGGPKRPLGFGPPSSSPPL